MTPRINYYRVAPSAFKQMKETETYIETTGIDPKLIELIKIRASQINGCAYCLNLHTADARKIGETEQRIYCLSAWRECEFYSDAERAALELTEYVTRIAEAGVPEEVYERVRAHYDEKQYIDLVTIINQINSWNRISISMGNKAGRKQDE